MNTKKTMVAGAILLFMTLLVAADARLVETNLTAALFETRSTTDGDPAPTIWKTAREQGFSLEQTDEASLLTRLIPDAEPAAATLLEHDDRTAFLADVSHPDATAYFLALKKALLNAFSPDVRAVRDTTNEDIRMLSFTDPTLSEEQFLFVLWKEHLLEFHISPGREDRIRDLLLTLPR